MTFSDNTEVHARTLTALFDTHDAADRAGEDLVIAGIPREHISLRGGTSAASTGSASTDTGFWESLKDLFVPDEDRWSYAEGLRRGGYLVSVRADEANYNRVIDIIDREGSVDMDERETTWRSEGWTGYQAPSASGSGIGAALGTTASGLTVATNPSTAKVSDGMEDSAQVGGDEVIPLYEEQLQVGKRDVSHGRVRLRSYVVETPVNEQVNLRSESVRVERRPVDRAIGVDDAVFQDRVIEAEERAEEAVISKTARVTEEISLRKTANTETRAVSDSVRRTEVEVEDERSGHSVATTTSTVAGANLDRKA